MLNTTSQVVAPSREVTQCHSDLRNLSWIATSRQLLVFSPSSVIWVTEGQQPLTCWFPASQASKSSWRGIYVNFHERTLSGLLRLFSRYRWRSVYPVVVKACSHQPATSPSRLCFLYPLGTRAGILLGRPVIHLHVIFSHVASLKTLCNKCATYTRSTLCVKQFKGAIL